MTTQAAPVGIPAGGRPINLSQLQSEIQAQGVALNGLGMADDWIYKYDNKGVPANFTPQETPIVQGAINAHVGMRNKTHQEYTTEFQNPATSPARKQDIRDMNAGLLPPEQVPMGPAAEVQPA